MAGRAGAAQGLVRRGALRYAGTGRAVIAAMAGALGVIVTPRFWPTVVTVAAVVAWSACYAWLIERTDRARWPVVIDVVVVALVCLTQRWTVPVDSGQHWVIALAAISAALYQLHTSPRLGACLVVVIDAAYLAGLVLAQPRQPVAAVAMAAWLTVAAALARLLWTLLEHGARRADELTARAERVRRSEAVAAAARADERAYIAALHDTAASTLLMVGLGRVTAAEPWLREQAGRDLAALGGRPGTDTAVQDVIPGLREVIAHSRVVVNAKLPDSLTAPASVCGALCGAVREALINVERHAGTREATVCAEPSDGRMAIVVSDSGTGFASDSLRYNRYGVAESIVGRMSRVGGRAELTSSLGNGTVVRMEWPALEPPHDR